MTSERWLFGGTIDADGHVTARPAVATVDASGRVLAWAYLDGHEPPATLYRPGLLSI